MFLRLQEGDAGRRNWLKRPEENFRLDFMPWVAQEIRLVRHAACSSLGGKANEPVPAS